MATALSRLGSGALDLLFPVGCAVCGKEGRHLCAECEPSLPRLEPPYCLRCADVGKEPLCDWCADAPPAFDGIRAPYLHEGAVREMVHALKYRNVRSLAPELAGLLAAHVRKGLLPSGVLTPVPLHGRAERQRGYNQSALLCGELAKLVNAPARAGMLRRTRNTPPQVSRNHDERRTNMVGAFECVVDAEGLDVILIDDVVTTGSTIAACADALRAAGAASVWGLALARQSGDSHPVV